MRNRSLKPRFLPRSLREPGPNERYEKQPQVLKEETSAKAQGLDDEIIEKVVGGLRKLVRQGRHDRGGVVDNLRNGGDEARGDGGYQNQLNEEKREVE